MAWPFARSFSKCQTGGELHYYFRTVYVDTPALHSGLNQFPDIPGFSYLGCATDMLKSIGMLVHLASISLSTGVYNGETSIWRSPQVRESNELPPKRVL